jgi:predicted Zn finger-like uncharacterized protein
MKFSCDSCHARYTIADEKVRGKILRVRCKKCGSSILLKEPEEEVVEQPVVRADDATHVLRADDIKRHLAAQVPAPEGSAPKFISRTSPAAVPPPPPTEKAEWYILIQKEEIGPLRMDELHERATSGKITPRTYLWRDGMPTWARLQAVPELADVLALVPQSAQRPTAPPPPHPIESKVFAAAPTEIPTVASVISSGLLKPFQPAGDVAPPTEAEVTPKDLFEKTMQASSAEARFVTAPPIDPSTLRTEIGTPSQETTYPAEAFAPPTVEAPPSEPAPESPPAEPEAPAPVEAAQPAEADRNEPEAPPVETTDPILQPAATTETSPEADAPAADAPAATEEDVPPEDEPVLFGLDKHREAVEADWSAPPPVEPPAPAARPPVEPTPDLHAPTAPLPSVMVNLGEEHHAPSMANTVVDFHPPASNPDEVLDGSFARIPISVPPRREPSASFVAALRGRSPLRRAAAIVIPIALLAGLGGLYLHFARETPPPVPPKIAGPPRPEVEAPKPLKKDPPKVVMEPAVVEGSDTKPAAPPHPKPKTEEEAAFAAAQNDSASHRPTLRPIDLIPPEEDLNHAGGGTEVDSDLLARKVKQIQPAIEHCVSSELHRNESFHVGKLKVNIEIATAGDVTDVTFDRKVVSDGTLGDCLRPAFKNIRMPPHEGEAQHVEIPLSLP